MDTDTIRLNCWIRGQEIAIFQVKISRVEAVFDLAKAIKSEKSAAFRDVDADTLRLYKPKKPVQKPYKENLGTFILSEDAELVEMDEELAEVFPDTPPTRHIHLIIDAPTIKCWFRGRTLDATFAISIRVGTTTSEVKEYIRKTHPNLEKVAEEDIRLYRIPGGENELQESLSQTGAGEPLQKDVLLANFVGVPVLDALHVVVDYIAVASRGEKRKREEDDDTKKNFLKYARLANTSPAALAKLADFKTWRRTSKGAEIMDHRCLHDEEDEDEPHPDRFINDHPPISLQYKGFGHFINIFNGVDDVPGMENVPSIDIGPAINDFANKMSLIYTNELTRAKIGRDALDKVFSTRSDGLSFVHKPCGLSDNSRSDGRYLGPLDVAIFITEFKNEAGLGAIPYIEMTGCFAHSTRDKADGPLMDRWNYPCLGMTIVAHDIVFYGMIYNGPKYGWRVDALTPGLSCLPGQSRNVLHKAFVAASVLLAHIHQDTKRLLRNPPPVMQGNRVLPCISSLRRPDSASSITFEITEFLFPRGPSRFLYEATTIEDDKQKNILVKFTESYSYDLHKFCADRRHAPKILGFQRLPGGYFGIAMERVREIPLFLAESGWEKQLQDLVYSFHDMDLVHGDLRGPNIILSEKKELVVIDFDWAGKEGEACYPGGSGLNEQLMKGRKSKDLKITKDDDLRVMCETLRMRGLSCRYCAR